MRYHTFLLLLAATTMLVPSVSATGWLINVEEDLITGANVKFGVNVFGGSGDTLDVGVANTQCNDEDDVVDVGVLNREGTNPCSSGSCTADQGSDATGLTPAIAALLGNNPYAPGSTTCSDNGDTLDAGLLNHEGTMTISPEQCDNLTGYDRYCSGDEDDGVDVGVLNTEDNDDQDGVDAGVVNCENDDTDDAVDVGLINNEAFDDRDDTFDASILNAETGDAPDHNGLNVLQGLLQFGCQEFIVQPPDPCTIVSPCPRPVVVCTTFEPQICVRVPP